MSGFESKRDAAADKLQEPVREALKLALEAMEKIFRTQYHIETPPIESLEEKMRRIAYRAIADIKEALAQPEQEQWKCVGPPCKCNASNAKQCCYAVFTTPPQRTWVGLTAEEIASIPLNEYTLQTAEKLLKKKNT